MRAARRGLHEFSSSRRLWPRPGASAHTRHAMNNPIGSVTSGGPAPTVGGAVGLAYVPIARSAPGTVLTISQRGRSFPAEVVKGPFYRRP